MDNFVGNYIQTLPTQNSVKITNEPKNPLETVSHDAFTNEFSFVENPPVKLHYRRISTVKNKHFSCSNRTYIDKLTKSIVTHGHYHQTSSMSQTNMFVNTYDKNNLSLVPII